MVEIGKLTNRNAPRTDNTMLPPTPYPPLPRPQIEKRQTMIYKILHGKLKIEQHEHH